MENLRVDLSLETYIKQYTKDNDEYFKFLAYLTYYSFNKIDDLVSIVKNVREDWLSPTYSFSQYENIHLDDAIPNAHNFFPHLVFSSILRKYSYVFYNEYCEPDDGLIREATYDDIMNELIELLNAEHIPSEQQAEIIEFFNQGPVEDVELFLGLITSEELSIFYKDNELKEMLEEAISGYFLNENQYIIYSWTDNESSSYLTHISPLPFLKLLNKYLEKYGSAGRMKNYIPTSQLLCAQKIYDVREMNDKISAIDNIIGEVMKTYNTRTEVMF